MTRLILQDILKRSDLVAKHLVLIHLPITHLQTRIQTRGDSCAVEKWRSYYLNIKLRLKSGGKLFQIHFNPWSLLNLNADFAKKLRNTFLLARGDFSFVRELNSPKDR